MSKSYNTVCPRPESCDTPRALMSVTPNLCCDETEPRSIHSPDDRKSKSPRKTSTSASLTMLKPLTPLFICFFLLPLGLPYVNWASQECCLFYLRSSLRSLDLPLTFLCSIFTGFSLPCLLATTILDSCFLFYLPNRQNAFPGGASGKEPACQRWRH